MVVWAEEASKEKSKPKTEAKAEAKADPKAEKAAGEIPKSDPATTQKAQGEPHQDFPDKEFYTKEEVNALREVLDKKSTELDQDLDSQKKYMETLKSQVSDHLGKIEAARNEIAEFMNAREEREEGKLKKLAKFYEAMDAEQAAPLLRDVQDDLAIKIFDRMDVKKAGTILAQMPGPRAAKLTQSFPKLRIQADRDRGAKETK